MVLIIGPESMNFIRLNIGNFYLSNQSFENWYLLGNGSWKILAQYLQNLQKIPGHGV